MEIGCRGERWDSQPALQQTVHPHDGVILERSEESLYLAWVGDPGSWRDEQNTGILHCAQDDGSIRTEGYPAVTISEKSAMAEKLR
jgi:hypothetical protein